MYPFKVLNLLVLKGISKIILILLVPLFIVAVIFFWKGISNNVSLILIQHERPNLEAFLADM